MSFQSRRSAYKDRATFIFSVGMLFLLLGSASPVSAQTPAQGLVAAYSFSEGSGTTTADASGNNNLGTISGATWTTQGKFGSALVFNGTSSTITVADSPSLRSPTTALTVSAWIQPNGSPQAWSSIIQKVNASNDLSYALGQNSGNTRKLSGYLQVNGVGYITPITKALTNLTWYFVVLTWQSGQRVTLTVYNANGAVFDTKATTQAPTGSINYDSSPLNIGVDEASDHWKGTIDNVRIYNTVRTQQQIQSDMTTAISASPADTTLPTVSITSPTTNPTYSTSSSALTLGGTAADNVGVTQVTWANDRGGSGTASGTTSWTVSGIALQTGQNVLTVTARDAANNPGTATLTVTYTPPSNLAAAYAFSEGSGTTTADASGNGNTGTLSGGVAWTTQGKFGNALVFDGATSRVSVANSSSLQAPTTAITVSAWIKPNGSPEPWSSVVQKINASNYLSYSVGQNASNIRQFSGYLQVNGALYTTPLTNALADQTWYYLALSWQSGQPLLLTIYNANGSVFDTRSTTQVLSGGINYDASPLYIGEDEAGDNWNGTIDEVAIYSRLLSASEIQANMNTPVGAPDTAPPTAPSNLAATATSSSQISLTWNASIDNVWVTGYLMERCQGAGCSNFSQVATPTGTTYNDTGLLASTSYSYRVRATDAAGNLSPYSNVASVTTPAPDTTPPTAPASLAATAAGSSQINLTWSASTDNVWVTGYLMERCQGAGCSNFSQVATPTGTTYNDTGLLASTSYSYRVRATDAAGNLSPYSNIASVTTFASIASQIGQWSAPFDWPIVAVHASLLPTGQILAWDYQTNGQGVQLWNPITNTFTAVPYNAKNLFCAGLTALRDGRILVAGGHVDNYVGITGATIFNPATQTWTSTAPMLFARWYPTATTLPDGRVLVTSGSIDCHTCTADTPEVYNPTTGTWTQLNNATLTLPLYPHMFVLPDGRVLVTGSYESYEDPVIASVLNLNTQTWTTVDPVAVNGGSAAMYLPGKIVTSGLGTTGGDDVTNIPSTATTYVLDMTQPAPAWRQTAPMAFPRDFHTLTLLPDGNVLVTGGGQTTGATDPATAVFEAELWSPVTETWTTMARMQVPRRYHSTALLLPDGRVLEAGGGRNNGVGTPTNSNDHLNAEIFSPPYLFKGTRPTITSAPATLQYGTNFSVVTPDASRIATVSLVRLGAVTHAFNMNQRFLKLTFQQVGGGLTVQAPANTNLAPPGYYMLFIVDTNGVPSVAPIVQFP